MADGILSRARDVGDFVYATPDAARFINNGRGGVLSRPGAGASVADILDGAAARLMDEHVPDYSNRAAAAGVYEAMGAGRPGSFASALGGGMRAQLNADLDRYQRPVEMEGLAARSVLEREQAAQAQLQNDINRLNFGYLTEPRGVSSSEVTAGSEAPVAGGGGANVLAGGDAGGGEGGNLPLTPQSQALLQSLQSRLQRALKFSSASPQARADAAQIYEDMAKVVQEDPLAKEAIANRKNILDMQLSIKTRGEESELDFDRGVRESIIKMTEESLSQAQKEFQALAANPDYSRQLPNLNNPQAIDTFIQSRARSLLVQKYAALDQQLRAMGKDPSQYLSPTAPTLEAPSVAPPSMGAPGVAPMTTEAPGTTSPSAPDAAPPLAPGAPPSTGGAFVPTGLRPSEAFDVSKEQNVVGQNINMLAQGIESLKKGLQLNEKSLEGAFGGVEEWIQRATLGIRNVFRPEKEEDVVLNNTAELNSILSSGVLQALSTLIKGNPTEGERAYVERLGATINKTKGERRVLMERALALLRPRLAFEQMRAEALAQGRQILWTDYEEWLEQSYGRSLAEKIQKGDFGGGE